jgi:hypothetical protein
MNSERSGPRISFTAPGALSLLILLACTACVSLVDGTASTDGADRRSSREVSAREREYLIDTPEHTVMETPWFTVSSVILQIQRTQPDTVIVLPADPRARRYLDPGLMTETPTTVIPGNRFLFSLGVMTDGVPAFAANPDRYRNPELYQ